jgi:hypothetical protein
MRGGARGERSAPSTSFSISDCEDSIAVRSMRDTCAKGSALTHGEASRGFATNRRDRRGRRGIGAIRSVRGRARRAHLVEAEVHVGVRHHRLRVHLGETGPLSQGGQEGGQALRILRIHGTEVRKKGPRGFS